MSDDFEKKIIVLFDEYGTPTLSLNRVQDIFLGVSVLYELSEEDNIFNRCDTIMGLSKSKPLKNDQISVSKAIDISKVLGKQALSISAKYLTLNNPALKDIIEIYKPFCNFTREIWRGIKKERKDVQILYPQILERCIFDIIARYLESVDSGKYVFQIFIDDWGFPKPDEHIALNFGKSSLEKKVRQFVVHDIKKDSDISIIEKNLLKDPNSRRKRFIDVLTSVISRAFRDKNDSKFDNTPFKELQNQLKNNFNVEDMTYDVISFLKDIILKGIHETKEKEKRLLIYK